MKDFEKFPLETLIGEFKVQVKGFRSIDSQGENDILPITKPDNAKWLKFTEEIV